MSCNGQHFCSVDELIRCKKIKVKADIALNDTPSQSYGTSLAIWDQFTQCYPIQVNAPRLTPAMQAGTRFTDPGGMEG